MKAFRIVLLLLLIIIASGFLRVPALLYSPGLPASPATRAESPGSLHVLFIGNSLTYTHDIPRLTEFLSGELGTRKIFAVSSTYAGVSLEWHLTNKDTRALVEREVWDAIVLQEGSTPSYNMPEVAEHSLQRWARLLEGRTRRVILYAIRSNSWSKDERMALDSRNACQAEHLHLTLAPVSMVWAKLEEQFPTFTPYGPDRHHPGAQGALTAALVILASIEPINDDGRAISIDNEPPELIWQLVLGNRKAVLDAELRKAALSSMTSAISFKNCP